ncbi:hydroxylysine kinase-like [Panonychus citri]|uniref:hydroxylysine kinase-like n=1 Tax=Panonychus citri TaxID=50023 RepID=UPI002307E6FC|nr:hydroxylysine kinase-like [Panonychus citri]
MNSNCKRPEVTIEMASSLVEKYFNVKVTKVTEANGYDDRNFIITIEKELVNHGNQFVLKVTNPIDSADQGLIEAVTDVSLYVNHKEGIESPVPMINVNGNYVERIELESKQICAVRLMKYIDGIVLEKIDYDADILYEIGSVVGRLSLIMKNYTNPILDKREMLWSLLSVDKLDEYLFAIENDGHRLLVHNIIEKFKEIVINKVSTLRKSIIHGDVNEQNVLVKKEDGKWTFSGLLDFGDSHSDPTIFDLAIACCYMTLDSRVIDPIMVPKYVIYGYLSVEKITQQEWDILPICVMARLSQSLTLGAYNHLKDPNNEYLLKTGKRGWTILEQLNSVGVDQLKILWQI